MLTLAFCTPSDLKTQIACGRRGDGVPKGHARGITQVGVDPLLSGGAGGNAVYLGQSGEHKGRVYGGAMQMNSAPGFSDLTVKPAALHSRWNTPSVNEHRRAVLWVARQSLPIEARLAERADGGGTVVMQR